LLTLLLATSLYLSLHSTYLSPMSAKCEDKTSDYSLEIRVAVNVSGCVTPFTVTCSLWCGFSTASSLLGGMSMAGEQSKNPCGCKSICQVQAHQFHAISLCSVWCKTKSRYGNITTESMGLSLVLGFAIQ
jgi:hypothetical protein